MRIWGKRLYAMCEEEGLNESVHAQSAQDSSCPFITPLDTKIYIHSEDLALANLNLFRSDKA